MKTGNAALSHGAAGSGPELAAPDASDGRLGRGVIIVGLIAVLMVANALNAALPVTPYEVAGHQTKRAVRMFVPEGWAFFTKDPRIPTPLAYRHERGDGWRIISAGAPSSPRHVMGFDRGGRAQGTELAMLMSDFTTANWHPCAKNPVTCLSEIEASDTVVNHSHRTVCGDVGIVMQDVLPWAWRNAPTIMPSKVVRIHVTC
jgi:antimicrobial peptide system SdpA family protein